MDNEAVHRKLHQKLSELLSQISGQGEPVDLPGYYGELLFESTPIPTEDENIKKAANSLLQNELQDDLPVFLKELLKLDREKLIAQLLEYYMRHQVLAKKMQNMKS